MCNNRLLRRETRQHYYYHHNYRWDVGGVGGVGVGVDGYNTWIETVLTYVGVVVQ